MRPVFATLDAMGRRGCSRKSPNSLSLRRLCLAARFVPRIASSSGHGARSAPLWQITFPFRAVFGDNQAWQKRKNLPTRARSSFSRWAIAWSSSATNRRRSPPAASSCPIPPRTSPPAAKWSASGDGRLLDNGKRSPLQVKVGDHVLFTSYAGDKFKLGTRELLLLREEDILAVIE